MSMRFFDRKPAAALAGVGAVLFLFMTSASEAGSGGGARFFTGGAYGPTPEVAVQAAIWDAEASAGAEGLYTCQLVGEPSVFARGSSPKGGPSYTAEATLGCTP